MPQSPTDSNPTCPQCNNPMEPGHVVAFHFTLHPDPKVAFVISGAPTKWNPIAAFAQGLHDERSDREYPITGLRCTRCGYLEFYAKPAD